MKSKFFAFAAVLAFGLLVGATASARRADTSITIDLSGGVSVESHVSTSTGACSDELMYRNSSGNCVCAVSLYANTIEQIGDECVPIEGYEWEGGHRGANCEAPHGSIPCFPMVVPKDTDDDGFIDIEDACDDDAAPASENGCPAGVCPDGFDSCMTGGGGEEVVDSDSDGFADDVDGCPTEAAPDSDDGCPAAAGGGGGGANIGGANLGDLTGDADDGAIEDATGGGFCTLIENASSTNALSALILAISLIPLGIRRKIK